MLDPAIIIGGSTACLTAALAAAERGRPVELYCDPATAGGGFAGVRAGERRVDLGARLFELDYEGQDRRPIAAFRPDEDGHRPFIHDIARFVRMIGGNAIAPAREPEMWIAGRRTGCVLMTVDLSSLPSALPPAECATVLQEVAALPAPYTPGADETLHAASLRHHGPSLHRRLVEDLCRKQWAGWETALACERRKLWAALFHPNTISEAFAGRPITFRPYRPFATIGDGQSFRFVDHLLAAVKASPSIRLHPTPPPSRLAFTGDTVTAWFDSPHTWPAETVALGITPEQLFRAAAIPFEPDRIGASVLWVGVDERAIQQSPSCLTICDPALAPFRISPAGPAAFAVEFGAATPCLEAARAALEQTATIRAGAALQRLGSLTGPAQVAPTRANRSRFESALSRFRELRFRGALLGAARRFGWGSLNDQIADGLHFGAARC